MSFLKCFVCVEKYHEDSLKVGWNLALKSNHVDAKWILSVFPNGPPQSARAAKLAFETHSPQDIRSRFFAEVVCSNSAHHYEAYAKEGYAFAQGLWAEHISGSSRDDSIDAKKWATLGIAQGDSLSTHVLASILFDSIDPDEMHTARQLTVQAAELGEADSYYLLATRCASYRDPKRFVWLGKFIAHCDLMDHDGYSEPNDAKLFFLEKMRKVFALDCAQNSDGGYSRKHFYNLGRVLRDQIYDGEEQKMIFYFPVSSSDLILANEAVRRYNVWNGIAVRTVNTWTIVGMRNRIVKDIRLIISKMLWESRTKWCFQFDARKGAKRTQFY
jgi:hypothetical protein